MCLELRLVLFGAKAFSSWVGDGRLAEKATEIASLVRTRLQGLDRLFVKRITSLGVLSVLARVIKCCNCCFLNSWLFCQ